MEKILNYDSLKSPYIILSNGRELMLFNSLTNQLKTIKQYNYGVNLAFINATTEME